MDSMKKLSVSRNQVEKLDSRMYKVHFPHSVNLIVGNACELRILDVVDGANKEYALCLDAVVVGSYPYKDRDVEGLCYVYYFETRS